MQVPYTKLYDFVPAAQLDSEEATALLHKLSLDTRSADASRAAQAKAAELGRHEI
jgi:hypothetical protein